MPDDGTTGGTATPEHLLTRATELRTTLLDHGDRLRGLRERDPEQRSDTWTAELRHASAQITALDAELTATLAAHRAMVEQHTAEQPDGAGPTAALAAPGQPEARSPGAMLVEHANYAERRSNRRIDAVEVRTLLSTEQTDPAAGLWMPVGQPIPPRPRTMRLFLRDLLPSQATTLNSVPYVRELNPVTNEVGATAVPEGAAKPEVTMQFESADAPVRKIAAWLPMTEEIVEDAPTLRGYVDNRLVYMLAVREQDQLLNGVGTTPHILGIRQTPGIQTQAAVAGDTVATIGRAISLIENVDLEADGIVMHPTDYWTAVTTRFATQFDAGFSVGAPAGTPSAMMWGQRVVRTRAMTVSKALVGAWGMSASIFDRRQATLRVTDSHDDYFVLNKLVVLAEERLALAVYRPDGFVEASLT